jgi:uncharacterized protein (DUF2225 family)
MVAIRLLTSTNTMGQRTTDLYMYAGGWQPMMHIISTCTNCGYSDYGSSLWEGVTVSDEICQRVHAELKPEVAAYEGKVPASVSYAYGARIAEWQGADHDTLGDWWLKAAWAAGHFEKDEANTERQYRLNAIHHMKAVVEREDALNPMLAYLIGELYRRIDDTEQATVWFNRAIEADDGDIAKLARDQRDNPRDKI